jgi:hypothetical protein
VFESVGTADFDAAAVGTITFMISARTVGTTPAEIGMVRCTCTVEPSS